MSITYEVRTTRNVPALAFDDLERARRFLRTTLKTDGWRIYKITQIGRASCRERVSSPV